MTAHQEPREDERAPISWDALAAELSATRRQAAARGEDDPTTWDAVAAELAARVAEQPVEEPPPPLPAEEPLVEEPPVEPPQDPTPADVPAGEPAPGEPAEEPLQLLDPVELRGGLEALLFVMDDPVDDETLAAVLRCPPDQAFEVWTKDIASWWPASHTVSGQAGVTVVFEPRVGGRIYERTSTGDEHDWGEVTLWEPPRRLGYLWHIRRDRADATDVVITFDDDGAGGTVVRIEHTGWERLGADGQRWRDANAGGWSGLLPHFVAACAG